MAHGGKYLGLVGGLFGFLHLIFDGLGRGVAFLLFGHRATRGAGSYAWLGAGSCSSIVFGILRPIHGAEGTTLWAEIAFNMFLGFFPGVAVGILNYAINRVIGDAFPPKP